MRKSSLLAASIVASGLALGASPAFAVYTGLTVTGNAEEISTISIKLPGDDPVTAQQTTPGHFGITTTDRPRTGYGTAIITMRDGRTRYVPAFVGEDGSIRVTVPDGNCFWPGLCGHIGADYSHFTPSSGSDGDMVGLSFGGQVPIGSMTDLQFGGGYHYVSGDGFNLDSWNGAVSVPLNFGNWRFGPTFGIQSNSSGYSSMTTFNYGAFVDVFIPGWELSAKAGGFSSNNSYSDGAYFGGSVMAFLCPDFALSGSWDHTSFDYTYGSDEDDFTFGGEYKISNATSLIAGYTHTWFDNSSFTVDTFFLGFRLYCDDDGATTLEERHNTGPNDWGTTFSPLSFRF